MKINLFFVIKNFSKLIRQKEILWEFNSYIYKTIYSRLKKIHLQIMLIVFAIYLKYFLISDEEDEDLKHLLKIIFTNLEDW